MSVSAHDFTLDGYRALLDAMAERDYRFVGYDEARPEARHVILRHDVDLCPDDAVTMAKVEAECGVSSTYFVRLRGSLYNPFAGETVDAMHALSDAGHAVGLHLDASLYADDPDQLDAAATQECQILESILGRPVSMISFHRPAKSLLGLDRRLAGRRHAYEPLFFDEMGYCSDSRGAWHYGHPLEHQALRDRRALQLLTHAEWWAGGMTIGALECLDKLVERIDAKMRDAVAADCEPYRVRRNSGP